MKTQDNSFQMGFGKLPPQACDMEEAVLGALMLEKDALGVIEDFLKADCFYKEAHKLTYQAIQKLSFRNDPVDILSVTQELKKSGELDLVGGPYFITTLTNRVASAGNIEYHARIIMQKFIQREMIRISSETIKDAFEDTSDVFDLISNFQANADNISQGIIQKNAINSFDLHKRVLASFNAEKKESWVKTGLIDLDKILLGLHNSDLIIIAARPGMGKTSLAISIAKNAALRFKVPTAFFSLEMSAEQLGMKLQSIHTKVPAWKMRSKNLNKYDLDSINSQIQPLLDAPIYTDDSAYLSLIELKAKCRRYKSKYGIGLIIIDYLQLINAAEKGMNREQEISKISRTLKAIAKDLEIPIIALSQLSRGVEQRGNAKIPQLSDLRDSGAIEQDADVVAFIYRPEYYGIDQDSEGNSTNGLAQIIIAKHRNGAIGNAIVRFDKETTGFFDVQEVPDNFKPLKTPF